MHNFSIFKNNSTSQKCVSILKKICGIAYLLYLDLNSEMILLKLDVNFKKYILTGNTAHNLCY